MSASLIYIIAAVIAFSAMLWMMLTSGRSRAAMRVSDLAVEPDVRQSLGTVGNKLLNANVKRRLAEEKKKEAQHDRLTQAGFYGKNSAAIFATVKAGSMVLPLLLAWVVGSLTPVPMGIALLIGAVAGIAGMLAPSFYLDSRKRARQQRIRRALPDALDILTVCLEGGMSLSSAFARVSQELVAAHPELALELAIVDRETRMGRTTGESVRAFADRFDMEELRSMASVIIQAERYGASVASAMDVFAETMRFKRMQNAETKAQQAVVKVIFPTLFCIFPCLFLVVIGPAAISIMKTLGDVVKK